MNGLNKLVKLMKSIGGKLGMSHLLNMQRDCDAWTSTSGGYSTPFLKINKTQCTSVPWVMSNHAIETSGRSMLACVRVSSLADYVQRGRW